MRSYIRRNRSHHGFLICRYLMIYYILYCPAQSYDPCDSVCLPPDYVREPCVPPTLHAAVARTLPPIVRSKTDVFLPSAIIVVIVSRMPLYVASSHPFPRRLSSAPCVFPPPH